MAAGVAWGAAVDAAASHINNIAQLSEQRRENKKDRQFQAEQNELDRAWQSQMQQDEFARQSAWQEKFWREQWETEAAYNSPLAQVNRLQAAGINPAAALYGGQAPTGNISSPASPSAPNPSAPASHSALGGHGISPFSQVAGLFSSIAQLEQSKSQSKLNNTSANILESKAPSEIRNVQAQEERERATARAQEEQAALTAINRSLLEKFGDDKSVAEINKLVSDSYQNYAQGNYEKAQTELTRVTEEIARLDWSYKSESLPTLLTNLKLLGDVYRSEALRNNASASESYSQVSVNEQLRDLNHYKSLIEKDSWDVSNATKLYTFDKIVNEARKSGIDVSQAEELLKQLRTNNLFESKERVLEFINRVFDVLLKLQRMSPSVGKRD